MFYGHQEVGSVYITTAPDFFAVPSASTRSVARRRATVAPWLTCGARSPVGGKPRHKRVEEADSRVPPPATRFVSGARDTATARWGRRIGAKLGRPRRGEKPGGTKSAPQARLGFSFFFFLYFLDLFPKLLNLV
jgi:hypothetical protein